LFPAGVHKLCLQRPERDDRLGYFVTATGQAHVSTSKWIAKLGHAARDPCPECLSAMTRNVFYNSIPSILVLEYPDEDIITSHKIVFNGDKGFVTLCLRGIVYHGGYHFTSHVIQTDGKVWYHDGQLGHICHEEGHLTSIGDRDLRTCKGRNLVLAVFSQV